MATFCLTKEQADQLKKAAVAGEINIEKMYGMTSEERRSLFGKHTDKETAQLVNAEFEKAMISEQQNALKNWAQRTFNGSEKKTARYKDVIAKIDGLRDIGVLDPTTSDAFLQDLVAQKLKVTITAEEAGKINEKSKKLQSLADDTSEFGTPSIEYFKARKEMEDYLDSLTPNSQLRVATETIGRGTMLASIKTPLLNIESNTVQGLTQAFQRRIETRRIGGVNNDYAVKFMNFANKVYKESGFDITRMLGLEGDRFVLGEQKSNTQGPGKVRKLGRIYEDLIFKKMLGAPDVAFSSIAFVDRANLESTKIAGAKGYKGKELKDQALTIFKDATSITPKTPEGELVRKNAIADAMYSTYTNKSTLSQVSLGIRKVFNLASGDLRAGDQIMPFVKTPANVIEAGLDASGVGLPIDMTRRMVKTIKSIHGGDTVKEALGDNFKGFVNNVVRAGLGLTFAAAIASLFEPDEFIGQWPTSVKEQNLLKLKNAPTNSLRIGNKWVSLDYFGPLGAPLVGMLYAKKYGTDLPSSVWNYYQGVASTVENLPGVKQLGDAINQIKLNRPGVKTLSDEQQDIVNYVTSFVRARAIPSIISDVAKGTDTSMRTAAKDDFLQGIKNGIPGLRQTLPESKNVMGDTISTEGLVMTLLFGSRVQSAKDNAIVKEFTRLSSVNQLPALSDIGKSTGRARALKDQLGEEKFSEAKDFYTTTINSKIGNLIQTESYKNADDETKRQKIDAITSKALDRMLEKYNYKKPKKK